MYAVIKAGGHQYRVKEGDSLVVDKIEGQVGDAVHFDQVLMVGGKETTVGSPLVSGSSVSAVIKEQKRAPKIMVFKYKRRKNYKTHNGHRQKETVIQINKIQA